MQYHYNDLATNFPGRDFIGNMEMGWSNGTFLYPQSRAILKYETLPKYTNHAENKFGYYATFSAGYFF